MAGEGARYRTLRRGEIDRSAFVRLGRTRFDCFWHLPEVPPARERRPAYGSKVDSSKPSNGVFMSSRPSYSFSRSRPCQLSGYDDLLEGNRFDFSTTIGVESVASFLGPGAINFRIGGNEAALKVLDERDPLLGT